MPLQFSKRQPRRALGIGTLMRLGSLAAGVILVIGLMQSIRSPRTIARLGELFSPENSTVSAERSAAEEAAADEVRIAVDRELLSSLDDDKPFRTAEADAWYHLLAIARDTPPEQLKKASVGSISYSQLMAQPDHYRGRVVSITGLAHRIQLMQQEANEQGISQVFEVVVQPGGTGSQSILYHCLELPSGFENLESPRPIRFEGLFLKNRVYGHALGLDKAPVIVGQTFEDLDVLATGVRNSNGPSTTWLVGVAAASAVLVGLLLRHALTAPTSARRTVAGEPASIAESLRELEEGADSSPREGKPAE